VIVVALRWAALVFVAVVGPAVVLTRDPRRQAITLTVYGLCLTWMFMVYQAPDVALAQVVVGAVVLPLMVLLALARMRRDAVHGAARRGEPHEDWRP
jgi:energy-converting hydrogenase B subunit D